jgi:hypothetical protein
MFIILLKRYLGVAFFMDDNWERSIKGFVQILTKTGKFITNENEVVV